MAKKATRGCFLRLQEAEGWKEGGEVLAPDDDAFSRPKHEKRALHAANSALDVGPNARVAVRGVPHEPVRLNFRAGGRSSSAYGRSVDFAGDDNVVDLTAFINGRKRF